MELENITTVHSSEKCEVVLGESEGKKYIKKTGEISHDATQKIARIYSPLVAKIREIGEDYIITEYAEGFPLSERKIPVKKVFEVALELCDALSVLHEQDIIHRDVKPSNIILCSDGHIKLIDFDAARLKKTATDKDTRFIGTDGFAPPEQYGFMQTDERSDIYAFGVTIKLLLAEDYASSPYKWVIEKCVRFNPEQRYGSIKAVKAALKRSKIMPFIILPLCIAAITATLVVLMNCTMNSEMPPKDMSESESVSEQSTFSSEHENSAPISVSSSSSSSSSSLSSSSSSSSSSSKPIVPPEDNKIHQVSWDLITLPYGFPRLRNGVDYYYFNDKDELDPHLRYFLKWDYTLSEEEVKYILIKTKEWLGPDSKMTVFAEGLRRKRWSAYNSEYGIVLLYGDEGDWGTTYFNIYPRNVNYQFPELNLSLADKAVEGTSERPLKWEDAVRNNDIPKLTDRITKINYTDSEYEIYWKYMDVAETVLILKKLIDSFDSGYLYGITLSENAYVWYLEGNINGKHMTIEVAHDNYYGAGYQASVKFSM